MSKNDESIWVRIQEVLHNVVPALSVFHIQGLMTCIFLLLLLLRRSSFYMRAYFVLHVFSRDFVYSKRSAP